jgi:hypothetical protein
MLTWSKRVEPATSQGADFIAKLGAGLNELRRGMNIPAAAPTRPAEHNAGGNATFDAELGESTQTDLESAVVEVWSKVLDEVDAAYPAGGWEILIVYVTVETGQLLIYPATMAQLDDGSKKVRIAFRSHKWASAYDAIAEPEDSRKFDAAYKKVLKSIATTVKNAMDDPAVAPRFASLKKRKDFAAYYVDQGETVHRANLVYLWGNRPSKAFPAETPKILFTGLMNKASIWPSTVLKFDGDQVTEATFFGAEFNDKYVDILASVPNVAELCKDLRLLILESTRIKPQGVERLKSLFPNTEVRVVK